LIEFTMTVARGPAVDLNIWNLIRLPPVTWQ